MSDKHKKFPREPCSGHIRYAGGVSRRETKLAMLKANNNWMVTSTANEPAKLTERKNKDAF